MLNQRYISDAGLRSGINGCVVGVMVRVAGLGPGHLIKIPFVMSHQSAKTRHPVSLPISLCHWTTGRPKLWLVYSETFKILSHSHQEVGFPHFGRNHRSARLQ